jgi:hypothetical protein
MNDELQSEIERYLLDLRVRTAAEIPTLYALGSQRDDGKLAAAEARVKLSSVLASEEGEPLPARRERCLRRAAHAKAKASATSDPNAKGAWERLAQAWTATANPAPFDGTDSNVEMSEIERSEVSVHGAAGRF